MEQNDAVDLILECLQKSHKNLYYQARKLGFEMELDKTHEKLLEYLKSLRV